MVYIFDFPSPTDPFVPRLRSVLMHTHPVLHARWDPMRQGRLVLCCGNQGIYTWSDEWMSESGNEEEMAECVGVPASTSLYLYMCHLPFTAVISLENFEARDVKWAPDGKGIVLLDKDVFCCAFEVEEGPSDV